MTMINGIALFLWGLVMGFLCGVVLFISSASSSNAILIAECEQESEVACFVQTKAHPVVVGMKSNIR